MIKTVKLPSVPILKDFVVGGVCPSCDELIQYQSALAAWERVCKTLAESLKTSFASYDDD